LSRQLLARRQVQGRLGFARSEDLIFIDMSWNKRTPEIKKKLFEKIANNLEASPGLKRADILFTVKETPSENWWVHGRIVNPDTGLDSRIQHVPRAAWLVKILRDAIGVRQSLPQASSQVA
jgi:phenylpyruvate tautomerase PptA (4-oxalocrotonate tautomerase family)